MAAGFPFHVVVEWMGHSDEVARHHYLRVNESDLDAAARTPIDEEVTQKVTQIETSEPSGDEEEALQVLKLEDFRKKAGDGIRTHDVQLGKSLVGAQCHVRQRVISCFLGQNEVFK